MQLTVYKASAGSGKTYTITREYLKQALSDARNPYLFRTLLAVTFTNKVTEEMKNRILTALNNILNNKDVELSGYLMSALRITSHQELYDRAKRVQSAILHDYSRFSISTIDAFFQKILHAFVREAGLRPGFNLELDTERLLEEAVDNLIKNSAEDETLRKWIFALIESRIEDNSSWNMRPLLLDLGRQVFSEQFKRFGNEFHAKISDRKFMESYAENLIAIISGFKKQTAKISKGAIKIIENAGLTSADFKGGATRSFVTIFYKASKGIYEQPKKCVYDALQGFDGWVSKTAPRKEEVAGIYTGLSVFLKDYVEFYEKEYRKYNTACQILKKFRELALLSDIDNNLREITGEENSMPISDSVHLISNLINNSDTPFIYEKTGSRFKSFMIDEFQDTSAAQWNNFKPLLHNSLAENNFSMVVGDVKQSIYRWRNGDWRILAYKLSEDFNMFGLNERKLDTNWRSKPGIIEFNNLFFQGFSDYMQNNINELLDTSNDIPSDFKNSLRTIIKQAYADVVQHPAVKSSIDTGYVNIDIIEPDEGKDANEDVLQRLPLLITELQDRGYSPSDIAILVRKKDEGQRVADCLLSYKRLCGDDNHCFDIISQDSLFINNSEAVQIVIAIMRLTINLNDALNTAFIKNKLTAYNKDLHSLFMEGLSVEEMEFISGLSGQSLNQVFESIVSHYHLNDATEQLPFLQELHDLISIFSNRKLSDISSFIDWWDDKGNKATLTPGDGQKAINILTIHKAKGLQFPVVIIPYANWKLEPHADAIWVSPTREPFDLLPYVPVKYSKTLENTDFYIEYIHEKIQSYVDNINLLYVAFTRAESELYITIPKKKRDSGTFSAELPKFLLSFVEGSESVKTTTTENGLKIESGERFNNSHKNQQENKGNYIPLITYPSSSFQQKLKMYYDSEDYFSGNPNSPLQQRDYSILLRRIFADIQVPEDCHDVINQLFASGLIQDEDKPILFDKVNKALQNPLAKQWFDGGWEIKTEATILAPSKSAFSFVHRPDRIMTRNGETIIVDFKFGLIEEPNHKRRLYPYMQMLKEMNNTTIKAYLWYVDMDKVIEINSL